MKHLSGERGGLPLETSVLRWRPRWQRLTGRVADKAGRTNPSRSAGRSAAVGPTIRPNRARTHRPGHPTEGHSAVPTAFSTTAQVLSPDFACRATAARRGAACDGRRPLCDSARAHAAVHPVGPGTVTNPGSCGAIPRSSSDTTVIPITTDFGTRQAAGTSPSAGQSGFSLILEPHALSPRA